MIYLASDHGGYSFKEKLKHILLKSKLEYVDLGPDHFDLSDDYPDYAKKVGLFVAKRPDTDIGLLICRSGQGMCVAANKIKGARAVSAWNEKLAYSTRNDDYANILCLAGDYLKLAQMEKIVKKFINTPFSKAPRHLRRVKKVKKMELEFKH